MRRRAREAGRAIALPATPCPRAGGSRGSRAGRRPVPQGNGEIALGLLKLTVPIEWLGAAVLNERLIWVRRAPTRMKTLQEST